MLRTALDAAQSSVIPVIERSECRRVNNLQPMNIMEKINSTLRDNYSSMRQSTTLALSSGSDFTSHC